MAKPTLQIVTDIESSLGIIGRDRERLIDRVKYLYDTYVGEHNYTRCNSKVMID